MSAFAAGHGGQAIVGQSRASCSARIGARRRHRPVRWISMRLRSTADRRLPASIEGDDLGVHDVAELVEQVAVVGRHEHAPQDAPGLLVGTGERRVDLLDRGAGRLEALGGSGHRGGDLRIDGPAAEVDGEAEAHAGRGRRRAARSGRADRGST